MEEITLLGNKHGLTDRQIEGAIRQSLNQFGGKLRKVLLLPPDYTRRLSGAGDIAARYYSLLKEFCQVDVMPAVGTHAAMSREEILEMFKGEIPPERVIAHNWREDVMTLGEIPADFVQEISGGAMKDSIHVEVNRRIMDPSYDLILSIGQVVPHEVAGIANYSKNIFVGCGGADMISKTHMMGSLYGVERTIGEELTPVRKAFDYAETHFLGEIPLMYVLLVTSPGKSETIFHGMFLGRDRAVFDRAVKLCRQKNETRLSNPVKKIVAFMDEAEYKSTWVANKAIYRSWKALAPGGQLIVIAPGVRRFGEDPHNDEIIRKYGYRDGEKLIQLSKERGPLADSLSAVAHLLQGIPGGKFSVTYVTNHMSQEEIESVGYHWMPMEKALEVYGPVEKETGFYTLENGEEYYWIRHPASGIWVADEDRKIAKAKEFEAEVRENLLPYWMEYTLDKENGGFYGEVDNDNRVNWQANKGLIICARTLWTYSAAYRMFGEPKYLKMAEHAYKFLIEKFWDNELGGVFWKLDYQGNPIDYKKQTYAQAFALYGLSEYYLACCNEEALRRAKELFYDLERHSYDPEYGGYLEAFDREWSPLEDQRLLHDDLNSDKTMNTHLHVLEAYSNLYRIWKDPLVKDRLRSLLQVFLDQIIDPDEMRFQLFFNRKWERMSARISYGHDIEGSWLLLEAAQILGDETLLAQVRHISVEMARTVLETGFCEDGGLLYEQEPGETPDDDRVWWVQAEAVVGFCQAWQLTGETQYLEAWESVWNYISQYIVDKENGEWFRRVRSDQKPRLERLKIDEWKCPYHNSRMCFEMIKRLQQTEVKL